MIVELRAKNCFVFSNEIVFSLKADMRNKKFATNVYRENYFNVLKTSGIYGPNNVGKTCLIKCIRSMKNILMHNPSQIVANIFTKNPISELGITFLHEGHEYSYDVKCDTEKKEYPYEKLSEIVKDQYGNEKEVIIMVKDTINKEYKFEEEALEQMMPMLAKNNILIYLLDAAGSDQLRHMKEILVGFASKIDIIDMNNIPISKTINLMKNENQLRDKVVDFIKNADLDMEDFTFVPMEHLKIKTEGNDEVKPEEKALDISESLMDQIRLVSVYKGVEVPSMLFDSTGTKKIAALASYIIEGLENGRILVVDELDSSIHFRLTRAIVAMFNNELNNNAQMIFTVHDINLMDCSRLFRKEQIWFIHKDSEGVYVYSLADFTAAAGIRDTTNIMEKYRKGALGALPEPDLIKSLLKVKGLKSKENLNDE